MQAKHVKARWILLVLLGLVFLVTAVTLLQPPAPPKPHPVVQLSATGKVAFMVLPFVIVALLVAVMVRRAYKRGDIRRVRGADGIDRKIVGRSADGVESAIHQRAATDAFFWLISVISLDVSVSQLLDRQPPQLAWWPMVGMIVFGLALMLHRRRLT
jgi:preprotein translocase subunit SecG